MHTICCSHQKSFAVFTNSVRIQIVKNNLFFSLPCNWLGLVFVDEETREQLKLYLTTRIHTSTTEATQQQPCLAHTYVLYTQTIVPYAMHRRVLNWVTICCDKSVRTRVCGFLNWDFPYLSIRPATILLQSDRLKKLLASHVRIRNQRYPSSQPAYIFPPRTSRLTSRLFVHWLHRKCHWKGRQRKRHLGENGSYIIK